MEKSECYIDLVVVESMSLEIVRGFSIATKARNIWRELNESLGGCNSPRLYELRRSIYVARQGSNSVAGYFDRMKRLCDEIVCVKPNLAHGDEKEKMMQFLMGLNDDCNSMRNQILLMNPLPNVARSYSMVSNVEKGKLVDSLMADGVENATLSINSENM
ncbi:hypothetical protein LIER_30921 [Lithospermum erythrorhizon]|uniref:Retrotransposon gag domain-containing protein n=1 Tax=Lithospermum erythrorhizon TaxID=34254 RepID=A0AAV3RTB3_LITER